MLSLCLKCITAGWWHDSAFSACVIRLQQTKLIFTSFSFLVTLMTTTRCCIKISINKLLSLLTLHKKLCFLVSHTHAIYITQNNYISSLLGFFICSVSEHYHSLLFNEVSCSSAITIWLDYCILSFEYHCCLCLWPFWLVCQTQSLLGERTTSQWEINPLTKL